MYRYRASRRRVCTCSSLENRERPNCPRPLPLPIPTARCLAVSLPASLACWILPLAASAQVPAVQSRVSYIPDSTRKVAQLTGDIDRQTHQPTLSRTESTAGVIATDLGSSFEHNGKLVFLFGDTWGRPGARDALAWTESNDPERLRLTFVTDPAGKWLPLTVPGIRQGAFEIPSYGVSIDSKMYVVLTTDHSETKVMGRSVLAVSRVDGTFRQLYDLSVDKFINVAMWKAEPWLYIFGSGDYRKSSVCLARIELTNIENRDSLRYFAGPAADGKPQWSQYEADAAFLFHHDVVGELSVAYCPPLKQYLMLYNALKPRGIVMRSAPEPWGPWSDLDIIFNPGDGYGAFMHRANTPDGLSDPDRTTEHGGEYGPFLISRYTSALNPNGCRIFYTMSTWNPYQVILMRSDLSSSPPPPK